jgi:3-isopropylmalate/(R)-2-methylmalate dehydratase large subunit
MPNGPRSRSATTATSRTLAEKVLSAHSGTDARAGDIVVCEADLILGTDGSTPMAIDYFQAMEGRSVAYPDRILLARDHYSPPTSPSTRAFHTRMQAFAESHGIELLPVGGGISFQVAVETGRVGPGDLVVGADSHTVSCGAVGAFATGIGSADLAGAFLTGKVWLRVPETMRVILEGHLPTGVGAKDVALEVVRTVGSDGAAYRAMEFVGDVSQKLPTEERFVLSNMSAEMGAKAGIFPADGRVSDGDGLGSETISDPSFPAASGPPSDATSDPASALASDPDASFTEEIRLDCSHLVPRVALPHQPANGVAITEVAGFSIDFVFLGTCTGGRAHDFREALRVLEAGGGIADGVTVVVTPPTPMVRTALEADGTLARLAQHGAIITETGCGPCCGTSGPIPPPNAAVISTANRNFKARMGEPTAEIYLASPATCAASASKGRIVDPREEVV